MSLDRNAKAQLDALVDKFDERIHKAIDEREVENKKANFVGSLFQRYQSQKRMERYSRCVQ